MVSVSLGRGVAASSRGGLPFTSATGVGVRELSLMFALVGEVGSSVVSSVVAAGAGVEGVGVGISSDTILGTLNAIGALAILGVGRLGT